MQPQNTNTIAPAPARTRSLPAMASTVLGVRGAVLDTTMTENNQTKRNATQKGTT